MAIKVAHVKHHHRKFGNRGEMVKVVGSYEKYGGEWVMALGDGIMKLNS